MKKKRKWRDIRSAVTMMCVMAAMLSTATYAWFSLTSSPTVTGLEMTAASSDGLKISKDQTNWYNAIDMGEYSDVDKVAAIARVTLMPATIENKTLTDKKPTFYKPNYTGNKVASVTAITTDDELKKYVAKCTYYLKAEGSGDVNVGITTVNPDTVEGNKGVTNGNPNEEGSFVKIVEKGDTDDTDQSAVEAVRVAFVVKDNMYIWEPNAGTTLVSTSSYAINEAGDAQAADVISRYDTGVITSANKTSDFVSQSLFTVGATPVQVDMYVWFEGKDEHCVDQIMKDAIEVQVQFTTVASPTTP